MHVNDIPTCSGTEISVQGSGVAGVAAQSHSGVKQYRDNYGRSKPNI